MKTTKRLDTVYHNGEPDGIRTCRKHMSIMTCYVVPRSLLNEAKTLTGINNPGIYFLIDDTDGQLAQIYIGQTRYGISRMDNHKSTKDFWTKAILFLAEIQHFSLTIIGGLEAHAVKKATESRRYNVGNKTIPQYNVSEFDMPIIEEIYEEIEFVLATQGYKLCGSNTITDTESIFQTSRRGIVGIGRYTGEKFELLPGSQIDFTTEANRDNYNKLRQSLLTDGSIIKKDEKYILEKVLDFNSPSGASNFVLGGSTNGWIEWKNNHGKNLDELFR